MKTHPIQGMPVMAARCKTCPFNEGGCEEVRTTVMARIMTMASQTCHTTGVVHGQPDTHLCRGARDMQLRAFHALGVLSEPTDAAWAATCGQLGIVPPAS